MQKSHTKSSHDLGNVHERNKDISNFNSRSDLSSLVIDWHFSFLLSTDQENPGSNPWLQDIEPDPPLVWTVHRQVTQLSPLLPTTALFQSLLVPQLVQQVQVNADIQ